MASPAGISITVKSDVEKTMFRVSDALEKSFVSDLLKSLFIIQGDIIRAVNTWGVSGVPTKRTGALAASFIPRIDVIKNKFLLGSVSSDLPYAGIHETGGVIFPKSAKMLAFPFPGVNIPLGMGPRDFPNLVFVQGKNPGTAFLMDKLADGSLVPKFMLKRFVRIRPKRYLTKALLISEPKVIDFWAKMVVLNVERS